MTRKHSRKLVFCLLFIFKLQPALGQIASAEIGINGLTCSQCSLSVAVQLRNLGFVDSIDMDLENTSGKIFFKPGSVIELASIPKAVSDAGFSTRFVNLVLDLSGTDPGTKCFVYRQQAFYFLDPLLPDSGTLRTFRVIAKDFLPAKAFKAYHLTPEGNCKAKEQYYLKAL